MCKLIFVFKLNKSIRFCWIISVGENSHIIFLKEMLKKNLKFQFSNCFHQAFVLIKNVINCWDNTKWSKKNLSFISVDANGINWVECSNGNNVNSAIALQLKASVVFPHKNVFVLFYKVISKQEIFFLLPYLLWNFYRISFHLSLFKY